MPGACRKESAVGCNSSPELKVVTPRSALEELDMGSMQLPARHELEKKQPKFSSFVKVDIHDLLKRKKTIEKELAEIEYRLSNGLEDPGNFKKLKAELHQDKTWPEGTFSDLVGTYLIGSVLACVVGGIIKAPHFTFAGFTAIQVLKAGVKILIRDPLKVVERAEKLA